jgi:Lrp/AsnC family transcriptional regulator, leucine-responsive regulatory protein
VLKEHDMPNLELDAIDRRIISTLQENGRLSNVELADSVGLSPSPCLRRVRRLEHQGYIEAYRAVLQRRLVGLGLTVFIGVKIEGHANNKAEAFQEAVVAMPETISCHLIAGDIDYLIEVVVPDLDHYQRYLVDKLLNLPIVREVRSYIAIQTLKTGAPLPLHHFDAEPAEPR